MNRYPLWKNLLILAVLVGGLTYALPNFYGQDPAIQIASSRQRVDVATLARIEESLHNAGVRFISSELDEQGAMIRFPDTDTQLKAWDLVHKQLGDTYTVALNLSPATPDLLAALGAEPMYLGLDLRGGVHFLMQMDMDAVIKKEEERLVGGLKSVLRESRVRYLTVRRRDQGGLEMRFRSVADLVNRIETFVKRYNPQAQPFAWTAATDSIVQKLERLNKVIQGTGH